MPGFDLSRPLVAGQAGVASEWADASVEGGVFADFRAQLNRGLQIDLSLSALASLDASFTKFIAAQVDGEAKASLAAQAQIQLPLNLFDEVGAAVRLRLAAEAAAGVSLALGLTVGDFLSLIDADEEGGGLPAKLIRILFEEAGANIGGGVYAKAAAAVMAHASLVVAGRAVPGRNGEKPGFNIIGEAGAGLEVGAGYRIFFRIGLDNFPKLIARVADVAVGEALEQIAQRLENDPAAIVVLDMLRAPAKTAFRSAFEAGLLIAESNVPMTPQGARQISLRTAQVVIEEAQRYLMDRMAMAGIEQIRQRIEATISQLGAAAYNRLRSKAMALADELDAMPEEPFQLDHVNYWLNLSNSASNVLSELVPMQADAVQPAAVLWSAVELIFAGIRKAADPQVRAGFTLANLTTGQVAASFSGPTETNPPAPVGDYIRRRVTGHPSRLKREHLVDYLVAEGLSLAVTEFPYLERFLSIFEGVAGAGVSVGKLLIENSGPFPSGQGQFDEREMLRRITAGLRAFLNAEVDQNLAPTVRRQLASSPEHLLFFDEVLLPSLHLTVDTAFVQIAEWESGKIEPDRMKELLSSIVLMLLGRTLVITSDVLMSAAQGEMSRMMNEAADHAVPAVAAKLKTALRGGAAVEELAEIVEEALRIGAEVFGPLPEATRSRIRSLMYEVIEPLSPTASQDFLTQLGDSFFIPNADRLQALAEELGRLAAGRFQEFVSRVLQRLLDMVIAALEEAIREAEGIVAGWLTDLDQLARALADELAVLVSSIAQLVRRVEDAFDDVARQLDRVLSACGNSRAREALKDGVVDQVYSIAKPLLISNPVYGLLSKKQRRSARARLKSVIRGLVDNEVLDTMLKGISGVANEAEDLLDELRDVDPGQGARSAVEHLVLQRIERAARAALGSNFEFSIGFTIFGFRIDLGELSWNPSGIYGLLRETMRGVSAFAGAIDALTNSLVTALRLEAELMLAEQRKATAEEDQKSAMNQLKDTHSTPRHAEILSPLSHGVVDQDLLVHIRLEGVPVSFLGHGANEQQRVFVWLNHVELPIGQFTASNDLSGLNGLLPVFHPGDNVAKWGLPRTPIAVKPSASGRHWAVRQGLNRGLKNPSMPTRNNGTRKPIGTIPGLALTLTLPCDSLSEGMNTLFVTVLDGRGARTTAQVAFFATRSLKTKGEHGKIRVGDLTGRNPGKRAPQEVGFALAGRFKERKAAVAAFRKKLVQNRVRLELPDVL